MSGPRPTALPLSLVAIDASRDVPAVDAHRPVPARRVFHGRRVLVNTRCRVLHRPRAGTGQLRPCRPVLDRTVILRSRARQSSPSTLDVVTTSSKQTMKTSLSAALATLSLMLASTASAADRVHDRRRQDEAPGGAGLGTCSDHGACHERRDPRRREAPGQCRDGRAVVGVGHRAQPGGCQEAGPHARARPRSGHRGQLPLTVRPVRWASSG